MTALDCLLAALPQPPAFTWDWQALLMLPALRLMKDKLARTPQHPAWHGEGDVWAHTRLVCEALADLPAFRSLPGEHRDALALAALYHDVGKSSCTVLEDGVLRAPRHAAVGAQQVRKLLWTAFDCAGTPERQRLREAVCLLIRHHSLPLYLLERDQPEWVARRIAAAGQLAPAFTWQSLCLLAEADVRGRIAADTAQQLEQVALSRELTAEAGCLAGPYPFADAHTARAYFSGSRVWPDEPLYDPTWGEVLLLCGLPGTGKDTWLMAHHPQLPVVSLDALRRSMGIAAGDAQGQVVQAAREAARTHLRAHEPFAWNATNLTPLRAQLIDLFEQYGARVRVIYLETPWPENLRRNQNRPHTVPEAKIDHMLDKLQPPLPDEAQEVEWVCG